MWYPTKKGHGRFTVMKKWIKMWAVNCFGNPPQHWIAPRLIYDRERLHCIRSVCLRRYEWRGDPFPSVVDNGGKIRWSLPPGWRAEIGIRNTLKPHRCDFGFKSYKRKEIPTPKKPLMVNFCEAIRWITCKLKCMNIRRLYYFEFECFSP